MCGIAGFYGFRNDELLKDISANLKHRGPDGEGYFFSEKVSLLSRRLAIIDRKGGDQPIYNEDGSIVVVYNGEIYNYQDLSRTLKVQGHIFKTKSDTEVIVHGYEQEGEKYFDRLNGMFALALFDKKKDRLILARDHFGIKPLYYIFFDNKLIFSSEIKPLFYSGLIKKEPNDRVIYRYLKYRVHDEGRETFFKGIYRLMPGEMITVQSSLAADSTHQTLQAVKFKVQSFTELKENLTKIKVKKKLEKTDVEKFRKILIEAIRKRLISEVPVGTCLSGGLDSSTVVALVNQLLKEKAKETRSVGKIQQTFSAVFPDGSNNEEKYVEEVIHSQNIDKKRIKSYKIYPQPEEFFKEVEDFIKTQEEPTISSGPYAQYKVMQEANKHVTVLLDGQGADEMMAGYLPYYTVYFRQLIKEKKYKTLLKECFFSLDIIFSIVVKYLTTILGLRKSVSLSELLKKKFSLQYQSEKFTVINDHLKKRLIADIFSNSLPSLLRYEDKNSMHFSIEGRVPFLDFNLLKYLFSLPDEAIINLGWNKNILRLATKSLLPKEINQRRNKIGFTTPEYQWFLRMKNKIYQIFLSKSFSQRPYFNQQAVLKAFQLFIEGKVEDTLVFWRLVNLELWLRIFFDEKENNQENIKSVWKFGQANSGKKIEITVDGKKYNRYPIKTDLFKRGDDYVKKIINSLSTVALRRNEKWFLVISEKVIAIAQGRSYFLWEIKPGFFAKVLSNFVTRTPFGIGLGSPWTMQLAIQDVGLMRILLASFLSFITKPLGIKGIFYHVAGETVAAIDGPTEYSLYPSNVSAKLGPKNPQQVAENIKSQIKNNTSISNFKFQISNFLGAVIIDANDLGQKVLGNSTNIPNYVIENIFRDNPMGQADEQTPMVIVSSI